MSAATTLLINGTDLKTYGFVVQSSPHDEPPDKKWLTQEIPERVGSVLISNTPQVGERELIIPGYLLASSMTLFRSNFDKLKYRLDAVPLNIVLVDDQTRQFIGRLAKLICKPPAARQFRNPVMEMELTFICDNPYRRDVSQSSVAFTSNTAIPLGTAPTRPLIRLAATVASVTNPVVTYKDSGAVVKATMDLTGATILAGDKIELDCDARTIIKTVSGTPSDASNLLVAGDFFALDPQHGNFETSTWPTLTKASGGAGTLTATAFYNKQWL